LPDAGGPETRTMRGFSGRLTSLLNRGRSTARGILSDTE
jgi:hypothetical protein